MVGEYGEPYLLIHRAHLHQALLDGARAVGVDIKLDAHVQAVDESKPSVTLQRDDKELVADLILGADGTCHRCPTESPCDLIVADINTGLKSTIRKAILNGQDSQIRFSPSCVYRTLIPSAAMLSNPLLAPLVNEPKAIYWLGPRAHIIAYPISNGSLYNFVLCDSSTADRRDDVSPTSASSGCSRHHLEVDSRRPQLCIEKFNTFIADIQLYFRIPMPVTLAASISFEPTSLASTRASTFFPEPLEVVIEVRCVGGDDARRICHAWLGRCRSWKSEQFYCLLHGSGRLIAYCS